MYRYASHVNIYSLWIARQKSTSEQTKQFEKKNYAGNLFSIVIVVNGDIFTILALSYELDYLI